MDADEASYPWYRRTLPLAGIALAMVIVLNVSSEEADMADDTTRRTDSERAHRRRPRHPQHHRRPDRRLRGDPLLMGLFGDKELTRPAASTPTSGPAWAAGGRGSVFLTWARLRPVVVPDDFDRPRTDPPGTSQGSPSRVAAPWGPPRTCRRPALGLVDDDGVDHVARTGRGRWSAGSRAGRGPRAVSISSLSAEPATGQLFGRRYPAPRLRRGGHVDPQRRHPRLRVGADWCCRLSRSGRRPRPTASGSGRVGPHEAPRHAAD